jgi:hypothetical protein
MKKILIGLCAFGLFASLTPKTAAQAVTITVGPATDDSYWVWNDEYQCWVWNGPEFQGRKRSQKRKSLNRKRKKTTQSQRENDVMVYRLSFVIPKGNATPWRKVLRG